MRFYSFVVRVRVLHKIMSLEQLCLPARISIMRRYLDNSYATTKDKF